MQPKHGQSTFPREELTGKEFAGFFSNEKFFARPVDFSRRSEELYPDE